MERPYLLHALSPLHAGTGQAVDVIDLPIARQRATGIPIVPGSSVKGVLRDARAATLREVRTATVFGPEKEADKHAGALVVGDARLLALPVRSFRGTFAWVTCPLLLDLARRDLGASAGIPSGDIRFADRSVAVGAESANRHEDGKVYLEDLDLPAREEPAVAKWAEFLAPFVFPKPQSVFTQRFTVADDETMGFLWETATQVDARVRIDSQTRTAVGGALWYEESLPPETVLIGLLLSSRSFNPHDKVSDEQVMEAALSREEVLQFGGKASVGRGRCRILPLGSGR